MLDRLEKRLTGAAIFLFIFGILWSFILTPKFLSLDDDFKYTADILSVDNFYDKGKEQFSGEQISKTVFRYDVFAKQGNILLIRNVFEVRNAEGLPFFSVERFYRIDRKTGAHAPDYIENNRTGYLFAPKDSPRGNYTYWHVNYDVPAEMSFQEEETINGLRVYRYEEDYHADQTGNLGYLPGVGKTRGINLDINLQLWVEPVSGRMIKYEDKTTAYYYDLQTGERLHPWNKFNNKFTESSIEEQVKIAKAEKRKIILVKFIAPALLLLTIIFIFIFIYRRRRIVKWQN